MAHKNMLVSKQKKGPQKPLGRLIIAFLLLSITLGVAISYVTRTPNRLRKLPKPKTR